MENIGEQKCDANRAYIVGRIAEGLSFSHRTYGEVFYVGKVAIERRSGFMDIIKIILSERLLCDYSLEVDDMVEVSGQVRTYNEESEGRNKLNIVIFVRELEKLDEDFYHENDIALEGYLCKPPVRRTSPLGREICDIMLAVNRMYNKSDYVPCIAWGRNAGYCGALQVGDKLSIHGRIQSRQYRKKNETGDFVEKTAYEVSILKIDD